MREETSDAQKLLLTSGAYFCYLIQALIVLAPFFIPIRFVITSFLSSTVLDSMLVPVATWLDLSISSLFHGMSWTLFLLALPHALVWFGYFFTIKGIVMLVKWVFSWEYVCIGVFYVLYWAYFIVAPMLGYSTFTYFFTYFLTIFVELL